MGHGHENEGTISIIPDKPQNAKSLPGVVYGSFNPLINDEHSVLGYSPEQPSKPTAMKVHEEHDTYHSMYSDSQDGGHEYAMSESQSGHRRRKKIRFRGREKSIWHKVHTPD